MSRIWAERDRVAIRDLVGQPWQSGVIVGIRPAGHIVIRVDDTETVDIRHPDDSRVIPAAEVPAETVTEWAVEWVDYPPHRFESCVDEAIARWWAGRPRPGGGRAVSRTVTRSPWQPVALPEHATAP